MVRDLQAAVSAERTGKESCKSSGRAYRSFMIEIAEVDRVRNETSCFQQESREYLSSNVGLRGFIYV
jgi:hypothetical protein